MISIIVPVYNAMSFLSECLDSFSRQTSRNFEVVLVDDGSTDGSSIACDRYAQSHDNCIVLHCVNQGPLLARREGILSANGEYILCVDADDCLREDAIELINKQIINYSPDIVCFDNSFGISLDFEKNIETKSLPRNGLYKGSQISSIKTLVCLGGFNRLTDKAIRKSIFDSGKPYEKYSGLKHGEDWLQIINIIQNVSSVYYLNEVLYFYRKNEQRGTNFYKPSQTNDLFTVLKKLFLLSKSWGKDYTLYSTIGACRHCFWLIQGISRLPDWKVQSREVDRIAKGLSDLCSENLGKAVKTLRLDYRCVLSLSINNHPFVTLRLMRVLDMFYRKIPNRKIKQ